MNLQDTASSLDADAVQLAHFFHDRQDKGQTERLSLIDLAHQSQMHPSALDRALIILRRENFISVEQRRTIAHPRKNPLPDHIYSRFHELAREFCTADTSRNSAIDPKSADRFAGDLLEQCPHFDDFMVTPTREGLQFFRNCQTIESAAAVP